MNRSKSSPGERCHVALHRLLSAGPQPASAIRAALEATGFAWRTVQDAAVRLKLQRTKEGMSGGWAWALKTGKTEDTSETRAFGRNDTAMPTESGPTCLAAYGYEVPADGLMHGVPYRD